MIRTQNETSLNASSGHKKIADIFMNHPKWKHYKIYQEYPVSEISKDKNHSKERFDWCSPRLKLIIEIHGLQHFKKISFFHNTSNKFHQQKIRDLDKKTVAEEAGYVYFAFPDSQVPDGDELYEMYLEEFQNLDPELIQDKPKPVKKKKVKREPVELTDAQKERNRQYRREQYLKAKQRAEQIKQFNKLQSDNRDVSS